MDMDWLTILLHSLPRFSLPHFERRPPQLLSPDWETYLVTLLSWSVVVAVVALVGLVFVFVVWTLHCCTKSKTARGKSASRLSCCLFLLCLLCFTTLSLALFGNERINRGVNRLTHSLGDSLVAFDNVVVKLDAVKATTGDIGENVELIREAVKGAAVNETDMDKLETELTKMENGAQDVEKQAANVNDTIARVTEGFHPVNKIVMRVEFERWICFASLFAIIIFVLFASSIGFCRHSKKAAVIFSGLGLVVYALGHLLLAVTIPLSLALADLCVNVKPVIDVRVATNASQQLAMFYYTCEQDAVPTSIAKLLTEWEETSKEMHTASGDASRLAKELFPDNKEVATLLASTQAQSLTLGTTSSVVTSHMACSAFAPDYARMNVAACSTAMSGVGLLLLSLLLFNVVIFVLLLVVGRAWHLYSRRSLDYVEVDEQDPFMPRAAAVPIDIYGSHVYNQRSRITQEGDNEASTLWNRENTHNDEVYDHYS